MKTSEIEDILDVVDGKYGQIYFFHDDQYLGRSLREYGEWAQKEINFLGGFLEDGSIVLDIGAFIGTHSMAFAKLVGSNGFVYSFEPHPTYFYVLQKNLKLNNILNAKSIHVALADQSSIMQIEEFNFEASNNPGNAKIMNVKSKLNMINVDTRTLDSFDIKACNLIKIDVEGMEYSVLSGALSTIKRCQPIIYSECNSADAAWPVVLLMRSLGYQLYLYSEEAYNPKNFKKNPINFWEHARELAIVAIPPHLTIYSNEIFNNADIDIIKIDKLDDLILCLIKKPQYKEEVLSNSNPAKRWGNNFWMNEGEINKEIFQLQKLTNDQDELINKILKSKSWRLTAPFRWLVETKKKYF